MLSVLDGLFICFSEVAPLLVAFHFIALHCASATTMYGIVSYMPMVVLKV
jgi:hypothetical protein